MSRSFGDNLSKENERIMADVRRDIWTSGFKGLGYGSAGGYILHTAARLIHKSLSEASKGKLILPGSDKPIRFNRNTAFFSVMAGGALGSFLLATTTGKNEVYQMHDIFEVGKNEHKTPYQEAYESARRMEEEESAESRRKRRISRRKTVSERLTEGHGLSDSHSGTWVQEGSIDANEQRRSARRITMAKRLGESTGLSDSRGGRWQEE